MLVAIGLPARGKLRAALIFCLTERLMDRDLLAFLIGVPLAIAVFLFILWQVAF